MSSSRCNGRNLRLPLHKGGEPGGLNNYRPIFILSTLLKVLERHVLIHLINIFFWQEPISCFSIRFQTKAFLSNSINQNDRYLANHKLIGVIFLDFRNAFYEVNHEILLKKLQTYGLGGMVVHLDGSLLIFRSISKGFYWAISVRPTAHLGRKEYLKGQYLDSYCVLYS